MQIKAFLFLYRSAPVHFAHSRLQARTKIDIAYYNPFPESVTGIMAPGMIGYKNRPATGRCTGIRYPYRLS